MIVQCELLIYFRFVFMALMEYCLVNIVLGDSDLPKPPEPAKQDKIFELAAKVRSWDLWNLDSLGY